MASNQLMLSELQQPAATGREGGTFFIPLLGRLGVARQLQVLGGILLVLVLVAAVAAYMDSRLAMQNARYVAQSSRLLMLSQRLAKDAEQSLSGEQMAFDNMTRSLESFNSILTLLDKGDDSLPPTSGDARPVLNMLMKRSGKMMLDVHALDAARTGLVKLGGAIASINAAEPELRSLMQQLSASMQGAQKERVLRLSLVLERMARDAVEMQSAATVEIKPAQLMALKNDSQQAEELLKMLAAADPLALKVQSLSGAHRAAAGIIAENTQYLPAAKRAGRAIIENGDALMSYAQKLVDAYQAPGRLTGAVMIASGVLVLLVLLLVSKVYLDDSRRKAQEAELSSRRDQEAIMRLVGELSNLADGDLTVKARVSDDITGAIAVSVNHTIDQLRKLVEGITMASEQVAHATRGAEAISAGLLAATQKQSGEITGAGEAVRLMTQTIHEVDASAAQAAQEARRTLEVTEQGARVVQNTIAGMDGICGQIQETSKRIKRLGESSQEIGEIVSMISDITEQTNVLALNAAIQAASAGEAGHGFSVVAEEVQRLAERSAEATRQIGALVNIIQGDTQDAVAAMEKSTQGVVEGAKLSVAAGQALHEIGLVTNELSQLIGTISVSTQMQANMAREVAIAMQEILRITEQTTESTRLSNASVAGLADLAVGLKNSVSGFKL